MICVRRRHVGRSFTERGARLFSPEEHLHTSPRRSNSPDRILLGTNLEHPSRGRGNIRCPIELTGAKANQTPGSCKRPRDAAPARSASRAQAEAGTAPAPPLQAWSTGARGDPQAAALDDKRPRGGRRSRRSALPLSDKRSHQARRPPHCPFPCNPTAGTDRVCHLTVRSTCPQTAGTNARDRRTCPCSSAILQPLCPPRFRRFAGPDLPIGMGPHPLVARYLVARRRRRRRDRHGARVRAPIATCARELATMRRCPDRSFGDRLCGSDRVPACGCGFVGAGVFSKASADREPGRLLRPSGPQYRIDLYG